MNTKFTSDPTLCDNARALRLLLRSFGPTTGRYHLTCPSDWQSQISVHINHWNDVDKKRANELLFAAQNSKALIPEASITRKETKNWDATLSWSDNILKILSNSSKSIDGALVHANIAESSTENVLTLDDLPFTSAEDRQVTCTPTELSNAAEFTLKYSSEVIFVDPYLDLSLPDREPVIRSMMGMVAEGTCESVKFFASKTKVGRLRDVREQLMKYKKHPCGDVEFSFYTLDDWKSEDRMHGRYLFSIHGGIRIDWGFQSDKRKKRTTEVSPIGENVLNGLIDKYLTRAKDLPIDKRINV